MNHEPRTMNRDPKINILLVDDRKENLLALEGILSSSELNLVKAQSGEEALKCLLNQEFAVILLDVQMPELDGFETAKIIRQHPKTQHTPIIFISAVCLTETFIFKGYAVGAVDYIIKPIVPDVLLSKVAVFVDLFQTKWEAEQQTERLKKLNKQLKNEIAQRTVAEEALRQSEQRYSAIVEAQTELIVRCQKDGLITFVNQAFCRFFGKFQWDIVGKHYEQLIFPYDLGKIAQFIDSLSLENPVGTIEHRTEIDGQIRWLQWISQGIFNEQGSLVEFQSVGRDISERKQAETFIQTSLHEKEVLLKEIHHRVKNNLQIISSLLQMQCRRTKNRQSALILQDSQNRIASIALIHEKLYHAEDLAHIDFTKYIPDLIIYLFSSYKANPNDIQIQIQVDNVVLDVEAAIPCGLIINELVSNSLKYAFPAKRKGKIDIKIYEDTNNRMVLIVQDNGVGIPENFDIETTTSLGLTLVQELVEQLEGTIELERNHGTKFRITFPVTKTRELAA